MAYGLLKRSYMEFLTILSAVIPGEILLFRVFLSSSKRYTDPFHIVPIWILAQLWLFLPLCRISADLRHLASFSEWILINALPFALFYGFQIRVRIRAWQMKAFFYLCAIVLAAAIFPVFFNPVRSIPVVPGAAFIVSSVVFLLALFCLCLLLNLEIRTKKKLIRISAVLLTLLTPALAFVVHAFRMGMPVLFLMGPALLLFFLILPKQKNTFTSLSRSGAYDILEKIGVMILVMDVEGGLLYLNRSATELLKITRPILGTSNIGDFIAGNLNLSAETDGRRNLTLVSSDGEKLPVEAIFIPVGNNPVQAYIMVCSDMKILTEALENGILLERMRRWKSDKFLQVQKDDRDSLLSIIENIDDGIVIISDDLKLLFCNRALEEMSGIVREDYFGFPYNKLDFLKDCKFIEEFRYFESGELTITNRKTGCKHDVVLSVAPVKVSLQNKISMIITLREITRQREENRRKTEFISYVSHEISSPLSSIQGFAMTLQKMEGLPRDKQLEYLKIIEKEASRLTRIIEELLAFSRLESYHTDFTMKKLRLDSLIREIIEEYSLIARDKGISIEFRMENSSPLSVQGDRDKIKQILVNFLSNAIKFSPDDTVVEIRVHHDPAFKGYRIDVLDQGGGLLPGEEEKVFDKFYRSDRTRKKVKGTGLGLSIAMDIARKHGGTLTAENRPGGGACFSLILPEVQESRQ